MANLYLSVKGQTLTVKSDIDRIVENSINYLKINIDTSQDSDWSGLDIKCILSSKEEEPSAFLDTNYITKDFLKAPGFVVHLVGYSVNKDGNYEKLIPTNPVIVTIHPTGVLNAEDEPEAEIEAGWADKVIQSFNTKISEEMTKIKQEQSDFIEETNTKITFIENKAGEALEKTSENSLEIKAIANNSANAVKGNVSESFIKVDDVSPIEHSLTVKVDRPNVTVSRYGKNLFPSFDSLVGTELSGVTLSKIDDYYVLNGTAIESINFIIANIHFDAGEYTISANNPSHNSDVYPYVPIVQIFSRTSNAFLSALDNVENTKGTGSISTADDYECRIRIQKGVTYNNYIIKPQLEVGTVATEYEPYKGVQTAVSNEDGVVEGLSSTSPNMTLTASDTDNIQLEYNKDTIKHIEDVTKITAKLRGKKIVNFGDSIFGKYRDTNEEDKSISTMISEQTGAKCYNAGFGGCLMTRIDNDWDAFSMHSLADSINSGSWQKQENALVNGTNIPAYFSETVNMLKSIDWNVIDMITIAYGVNDYTSNKFIEDTDSAFVNEYDYYKGALRYSIKQILKAYPHIKITVITPLWKWNRKVDGSFDYSSDDIDKSQNTRGYTLIDYVNACIDVSNELHVSCIDNYNLGINEYNYLEYFNSNDGTHPNKKGRQLCADNIVSKILTNDSEKSVNFEKISGDIKEEIDEVRAEMSAIGDRVDELIDAEILSASSFVNGDFKEGKGIVASEYWIIMKKSIPVKIGDKITIKPNGLKVWWRIHNSDDLSVAVNVSQDANKVITEDFEFTSKYDGWFNAQICRVDSQRITPSDYVCDIKVGTSIFEKIENLENNISQKQDKLKDGENIKTINGQSILGSGSITIDGGEETSTSSGTLFSKHTPFTHIIEDCQDANKWTIENSSDSIVTEDTEVGNFIFGKQSLHSDKLMNCTAHTYDLTNNYLIVKIRINSINTGARLYMMLSDTNHVGLRYELARGTNWTVPEDWQEIIIPINAYAYGTNKPDFSQINHIKIFAERSDGSAGGVDWNLQYVGTRPKVTNKGIVTFTFDDGWSSQYTGVKLLAEKGITSTIFAIKEAVESNNYLTLDEIKSLVNLYGTDIEVHGDPAYTNPIWTEDKLKTHWSESQKFIRENGLGEGKHMAYPNGMFPENVVELAKDYFDSCRTIIPFMPVETLPVADRYRIRAVSGIGEYYELSALGKPLDKLSNEEKNKLSEAERVKKYIDRVAQNGGWLILVLHKVGENLADSMYCSENYLSTIADHAIDSGVDIMNYAEVMERFYADLSPEKVPTASGEDIVIPENVETTDNKVTTIDENSTDTQYPSAKAVYNAIGSIPSIEPIVDRIYDPYSSNAQSGEAVAQAIDEALENFEGGGGNVEIPENIETADNKVQTIDKNSTETQYPSAKAVYDFVGNGGSNGNIEVPENVETTDNKVYVIDGDSTNDQYPSAKAVYDLNEQTFERGKNLFNGKYEVGRANGDDSKINESRSEWIKVEAGETYTFSHDRGVVSGYRIYGNDLNPVHEGSLTINVTADGYTFMIPEGITHIRFSSDNSIITTGNVQIEKGSVKTFYEPYRFCVKPELIESDEALSLESKKPLQNKVVTEKLNKKVELSVLPTGKNLLNKDRDTEDVRFLETGEFETATNYRATDFIRVISNKNYRLSNNGIGISCNMMLFFDKDKILLSYNNKLQGTDVIVTPENTKFVRFSYHKSNTQAQFEQNSVVTEYESFISSDLIDGDTLYVHNESLTPEKMSFFTTKAGGKNLLDVNGSMKGYQLTETGDVESASNVYTSDYIAVRYDEVLTFSGTPDSSYSVCVLRYALYDENKKCIAYITNGNENYSNPLTIPRNVKFIRVTFRGTDVQIERGSKPTKWEAFKEKMTINPDYLNLDHLPDNYFSNPWVGKKIVVDGDSITHDDGKYYYWQFVAANILGMDLPVGTDDIPIWEPGTVDKPYPGNGRLGISGSRIANEENAGDVRQSIVLRYQNLPSDADLVVIAGGTNDWSHDKVPMGDFDSTDNATFNGALNELLPALKTKYPTIPVVMMTPIKRGTVYNRKNEYGLTQEDYVDAMIKKCRQYGVHCLDMYSNCPINPQIPAMKELLFKENDDTHPNKAGHNVMGKTVAGFIRTLS